MSAPITSGPTMSGQSADQGSRGVQVNEARSEAEADEVSRKTSAVVIPEIPPDPADTPIARAAEAAVGVRGGRQPWPLPPRCRIMTIANQ